MRRSAFRPGVDEGSVKDEKLVILVVIKSEDKGFQSRTIVSTASSYQQVSLSEHLHFKTANYTHVILGRKKKKGKQVSP